MKRKIIVLEEYKPSKKIFIDLTDEFERLPLGAGGEVYYHNKWLDEDLAMNLFEELDNIIDREPKELKIAGRLVKTPRNIVNIGVVGSKYYYSGQTSVVTEDCDIEKFTVLKQVKNELRNLAIKKEWIKKNQEFDFVLVNYYENGEHNIGAHSDDEKDLDSPTIISLSLGATRKFIFKHKNYYGAKKEILEERQKRNKSINLTPNEPKKISINLHHRDLIVMTGKTQHAWKHEIPKEKNVNTLRINLTFRVSKKQ